MYNDRQKDIYGPNEADCPCESCPFSECEKCENCSICEACHMCYLCNLDCEQRAKHDGRIDAIAQYANVVCDAATEYGLPEHDAVFIAGIFFVMMLELMGSAD